MVTHNALLIRLLAWVSPAFPIGSYAYSYGLEYAIAQGDVKDRETLCDWIASLLGHGSIQLELVSARAAFRADTYKDLCAVAQMGCAMASSRERFEETVQQGEAFLRAVRVWGFGAELLEEPHLRWPLAVAYGAVFRQAGMDEEMLVLAYVQGVVNILISVAVRLVPLGQTDGLRALAAMEVSMTEAVQMSATHSLEEAGSFSPRADLAAMQHETLEMRLFRT
ncbi:urease accessory protein UreF [Saccharibacter sp. 17.LH.SD]|uniref:urease accessory protein UreF n=1 Tax=Saccharibacter sp. 17.LH.SD TaxID=2689393 RepID=UPI00136B7A55|nr:urease accessory UreF family protein [Saccharibacter sp. 17.LH.SD]MXV44961.1 urease accessory protein UreF [Saccharibacter sp. 17.LH.SD]